MTKMQAIGRGQVGYKSTGPKLTTLKLTAACAALAVTPAFAAIPVTAPFKWSMPDRLLEDTLSVNHDPASPIPKYDPNAHMRPAGGWTVNFDACEVTAGAIVRYEWFVDGVAAGNEANCIFSRAFPKEAKYHVALKLTDASGMSATVEQDITVQDWLIIALGDSYGSGEGNPDKPVTAQAHIDANVLTNLAADIHADLQAAVAKLPGLVDAQAAAQQLRNDASVTVNQAASDLARVQQDLADLIRIQTNVEGYPSVILARAELSRAQSIQAQRQSARNAALAARNACSGFFDCLDKNAKLAAAEVALAAAKAEVKAAQQALTTVRNAAVVIHSTIATIQNFDGLALAISSATTAVNLARNVHTTATNALQNANSALQKAKDAVAEMQSIRDSFQYAWTTAKTNAQRQYLEHLPKWTVTPPSWGTREPGYYEILTGSDLPGSAMRCHRSMTSGQARAALAIEKADPHTSVTLVHLSCSGAKIDAGLVGGYGGANLDAVLDPLLNSLVYPAYTGMPEQPHLKGQVMEAAEKILGREVDAVVVSIGGNDIRFADLIMSCIKGEPCHMKVNYPPSDSFSTSLLNAIDQNCRPVALINQLTGWSLPAVEAFSFSNLCMTAYDTVTSIPSGEAAMAFSAALPAMADKWQSLSDEIARRLPALDTRRVYLTEYPDPTRDEAGVYCGWSPSQPAGVAPWKNLPGVTQPEITWADTVVAAALRDSMASAAQMHRWKFVSGIAAESQRHGYCAADHWVIRIPETLVTQQDQYGAVHPNAKGHAVYQRAIFAQLKSDFYPNGIGQEPRLPASND